jgi:nucleotide-binding universal stress UspA family protein
MYRKILVAIDRSPISDKVFQTAVTLAKGLNSQLMLLHVLSQEAQDSPISFAPYSESFSEEVFESFQKEWESFERESLKHLQQWAQQANEQGVITEITQLKGNPASSLVKFSQDWGAELIIVGRRGHSTLGEIILGSVSSYIIHRSHCAVHIVQT